MPLARYFLFVGGALLALLFLADAVLPKLPVADRTVADVASPAVRIHSDRKWPEQVVFDTSLPTIVPPPTAQAEVTVTDRAVAADLSAQARAREALAQLVSPEPKKPEHKPPHKRRFARKSGTAPTMLVERQPAFDFFANSTW